MFRLFTVILILAFSGPSSLLAQATTDVVRGTVQDSEGRALPGANVLVVGTNSGTVSGRDGEFRIAGVERGSLTLEVSLLGYETQRIDIRVPQNTPASVTLLETAFDAGEVVVYATLTRGQAKALNDQKNAPNVRNVVSSEQFSTYPDVSLAETVQRIPGISITRDQGEGEFVQVRGISEQLNALTVNGIRMPSMEPDAGRSVGLDMVQTSLVERVTVAKALTPDMDGDAIGGAVDFQMKRAGERPEFSVFIAGGYNDQESEIRREMGREIINGSVTASKRFRSGKLGLLGAGSYNSTDRGSIFKSWRYEEDGTVWRHRITDYDINRERWGVVGHADYRFNPENRLDLTLDFNAYEDDELRHQARYQFNNGREERRMRNRIEDQEQFFGKLSGEHFLGRGAKLNWYGAWARGEEDLPDRTEFRFRRTNEALEDLSSAERNALWPTLGVETTFAGVNDPLSFTRASFTPRNTEDKITTGGLDLSIPVGTDNRYTVQAGGKIVINDREFRNGSARGEIAPGFEESLSTIPPGVFPFPDVRWTDGDFVDLGFLREEPSEGGYNGEETIAAGYVMGTAQIVSGVSALAGVRIENTSSEYEPLSGAGSLDDAGDYTTILPSVHLTWRGAGGVQLRGAWSTGLSRPEYTTLIPFENVSEGNDGGVFISRGNPDLEPTFAHSFDLMGEWYTNRLGFVSVGVFAKFLDDIIVPTEFAETFQGELAQVRQQRNAGSADLFGFEVAVQQSLAVLGVPALSGLRVNANFTYTDSETDDVFSALDPELGGSASNFELDELPLLNSPERIGNLSLTYEDRRLTAVLAGVYRAGMFNKFEDGIDIWLEETLHLDASLAWRFPEQNLSVVWSLNNITNQANAEIEHDPSSSRARLHEKESYSFWTTLGVRYGF